VGCPHLSDSPISYPAPHENAVSGAPFPAFALRVRAVATQACWLKKPTRFSFLKSPQVSVAAIAALQLVRAQYRAHVRGIRLGGANQTASANHDPPGRDLGEADTAVSIMERMTANRVRHIPVVDRDRLVGIVSIGDIVKHRLWEMEQESTALRDYIQSA
jgi:CBS domain